MVGKDETPETFKGKSIIVGLTKHFEINKVIVRELKSIGFSRVEEISFQYTGYTYESPFQWLKSFFIKNFTNRPHYKQALAFEKVEKEYVSHIEKMGDADFALLIRPDIYSKSFIRHVYNKSKKTVGYQWDGISRFPAVKPLIAIFDRFFAFDPKDLHIQGVLPVTNFTPSSYSHDELYDPERSSDVYFSGSYIPNRIPMLKNILQQCSSLDLKAFYLLTSTKHHDIQKSSFNISKSTISFEENLKNTYNTKIIIDLLFTGHKGLSFRVFDALTFNKKLITTNPDIVKYDFYDSHNILLWTDQTTEMELKSFIGTPYRPVTDELKHKYSFKNWIRYILDEGDYIPINLPTP